MLIILFGIPYGIMVHRDLEKGLIAYIFILISILTIFAVASPLTVVDAIESTSLAEWFILFVKYFFGVGLGWILSASYSRLRERK